MAFASLVQDAGPHLLVTAGRDAGGHSREAVRARVEDAAAVACALLPASTPHDEWEVEVEVELDEEEDCPGVVCVYRYTFMTADKPAEQEDEAGDEDGQESAQTHPWSISRQLHILCPLTQMQSGATQLHPIGTVDGGGSITFDPFSLVHSINKHRLHLEMWWSGPAAAGLFERWQERQAQQLGSRNLPDNIRHQHRMVLSTISKNVQSPVGGADRVVRNKRVASGITTSAARLLPSAIRRLPPQQCGNQGWVSYYKL